jgi:hypothetical protein
VRVATLSFLRSQLKYAMIEFKTEKLTDEQVTAVVKKQVKQRQDSITQYEQGHRKDLADKERQELDILKSYLPEQLSEEQVSVLVAEAVRETGASGLKDMGAVMKTVLAKAAGRADNRTVSELVRKELGGS